MKSVKRGWLVVLLLLVGVPGLGLKAQAGLEQSFPLLTIGTHTYTNVTVTTKSKSYVFILHSQGMTNLKVSDLPADVLAQLGYSEATAAPAPKTNSAAAWSRQAISKIEVPELKNVQTQLLSTATAKLPFPIPAITATLVFGVLAVMLAIYIFECYCFRLICKKAGSNPGFVIWLPGFQVFPLLKAARMSYWWVVLWLVPAIPTPSSLGPLAQVLLFAPLVAYVMWCFKIADARGKTWVVGLLLLLPVLSLFAFLYLAFSSGVDEKEKSSPKRRVGLMTLETA